MFRDSIFALCMAAMAAPSYSGRIALWNVEMKASSKGNSCTVIGPRPYKQGQRIHVFFGGQDGPGVLIGGTENIGTSFQYIMIDGYVFSTTVRYALFKKDESAAIVARLKRGKRMAFEWIDMDSKLPRGDAFLIGDFAAAAAQCEAVP